MKHYSLKTGDNIVYWFYYNNEPIDSTIFPRQATYRQIMDHAINQHQTVPLHFPPYEHESHLRRSKIFVFDPDKKEIKG